MGFESIGVTLRSGRTSRDAVGTFAAAIRAVTNLKHAAPDASSELTPGSPCFLVSDGEHAIEIEVSDEPVTVSCRFTLCHPPSVDAVFIGLVKQLMETLDMRVEIRAEIPPGQPREFTLATFNQFASILTDCIAKDRREWKAAFGERTLGATTVQVHEAIIAPLCQHTVEQAG